MGEIDFCGIIHGKIEFAYEVRRLFYRYKPSAIAVELPSTLKNQVINGVKRLPEITVVYYENAYGETVYLIIEPTDGIIEAIRLGVKHHLPIYFVDRDSDTYPIHLEFLPDSYSIRYITPELYRALYERYTKPVKRTDEDILREKTMAYHLQKISEKYDKSLFVCGLNHLVNVHKEMKNPLVQPIGRLHRSGIKLARLSEESFSEVLTEIPYVIGRFIQEENKELDRLDLYSEIFEEASKRYEKNYSEEIKPWQKEIFSKFSRNYALMEGHLTPDFYQLIIAARGAVDDNFAYEFWEVARSYIDHHISYDLPLIKLNAEDLFLHKRRVRLFRRLLNKRKRFRPIPLRAKPKEAKPGEWRNTWKGITICSYPPEDRIVEGYGHYVKKRVTRLLSEENFHVEPFSTSMLDGVDIRETIRHFYEDGSIYVRAYGKSSGKVGSVIFIFDPDLMENGKSERFPWKTTWHGEHDQESDMAFYATPMGQDMVGPGISRCIYGGFLLSYPPGRLFDIWQDPYFNFARTKPERLLLAGLDYSEEDIVAYVAAKPPSFRMRNWANKLGKKIVYIPIGLFSPPSLKKIRIFHVLDGHYVRKYAHRFIITP